MRSIRSVAFRDCDNKEGKGDPRRFKHFFKKGGIQSNLIFCYVNNEMHILLHLADMFFLCPNLITYLLSFCNNNTSFPTAPINDYSNQATLQQLGAVGLIGCWQNPGCRCCMGTRTGNQILMQLNSLNWPRQTWRKRKLTHRLTSALRMKCLVEPWVLKTIISWTVSRARGTRPLQI